MNDPIFDHDREYVLRLKEELKMAKKEIAMLRKCMKTETPQEAPSSAMTLTKTFQKLYREAHKVGYVITNWATQNMAMKTLCEIFTKEGLKDEDVVEFLKWAVKQKTHTGGFMTIPYLRVVVQDYFHQMRPATEQPVELPVEQQQQVRDVLNRRFGKNATD